MTNCRLTEILTAAKAAGIITPMESMAIAAAVMHVDDEMCESFSINYGNISVVECSKMMVCN